MGIVGLTKTVAKEWGPFGVRYWLLLLFVILLLLHVIEKRINTRYSLSSHLLKYLYLFYHISFIIYRCNGVAFGFIETRLTASKETGEFMEVKGKKV